MQKGRYTAIKQILGLAAGMLLRCNGCIKYHQGKCHELFIKTQQEYENFAVANIAGGTMVIPLT